MVKLRVFDLDERGFLAQLGGLLALIDCARFRWSLLELVEAHGDVSAWFPDGLVALEARLEKGPLVLLPAQLSGLAGIAGTTAWLGLIGEGEGMRVEIRLHDSSFWEIETDSSELATRVRQGYSNVREVLEFAPRYLAALRRLAGHKETPDEFRAVLSSAIERGAFPEGMSIEEQVFDESYLGFLERQIELSPRGPEWNAVLSRRLSAFRAYMGVPLLRIAFLVGGQLFIAHIRAEDGHVVHTELD